MLQIFENITEKKLNSSFISQSCHREKRLVFLAVAYLQGGQGGRLPPLTSHKQQQQKNITMDKKKYIYITMDKKKKKKKKKWKRIANTTKH